MSFVACSTCLSNEAALQEASSHGEKIMARPGYSYPYNKADGCLQTITSQLEDIKDMLKLKNGLEDIKYKLQETLNLAKKIEPYAVAKSTPLSPFLTSILEHTAAMDFRKLYQEGKLEHNFKDSNHGENMISYSGQVQLLQFLLRKTNAKKILEIGTFMGYASFGMAEAMAEGGTVTGIDIEPLFCDFVNELSIQKDIRVEVINDDAMKILLQLAETDIQYDFIYIDCVKRDYKGYYKIIMDNKMLASDGLIVCNNCISKGESISRNTSDGAALDDFNNTVLQDDRVSSVMLPCFDGTLLIQNNQK